MERNLMGRISPTRAAVACVLTGAMAIAGCSEDSSEPDAAVDTTYVPTGDLEDVPSSRILHAEIAEVIGCGEYSPTPYEHFTGDGGVCRLDDSNGEIFENQQIHIGVYPSRDLAISSQVEWKSGCAAFAEGDEVKAESHDYVVVHDNWNIAQMPFAAVEKLQELADLEVYLCEPKQIEIVVP